MGRGEKRVPLKTPAWEARSEGNCGDIQCDFPHKSLVNIGKAEAETERLETKAQKTNKQTKTEAPWKQGQK